MVGNGWRAYGGALIWVCVVTSLHHGVTITSEFKCPQIALSLHGILFSWLPREDEDDAAFLQQNPAHTAGVSRRRKLL